jgi:hypothetical protein
VAVTLIGAVLVFSLAGGRTVSSGAKTAAPRVRAGRSLVGVTRFIGASLGFSLVGCRTVSSGADELLIELVQGAPA